MEMITVKYKDWSLTCPKPLESEMEWAERNMIDSLKRIAAKYPNGVPKGTTADKV